MQVPPFRESSGNCLGGALSRASREPPLGRHPQHQVEPQVRGPSMLSLSLIPFLRCRRSYQVSRTWAVCRVRETPKIELNNKKHKYRKNEEKKKKQRSREVEKKKRREAEKKERKKEEKKRRREE